MIELILAALAAFGQVQPQDGVRPAASDSKREPNAMVCKREEVLGSRLQPTFPK